MYSLWIVQWDFTRQDHLENLGRVSGSGLVMHSDLFSLPDSIFAVCFFIWNFNMLGDEIV